MLCYVFVSVTFANIGVYMVKKISNIGLERNYLVQNVSQAKEIARGYVDEIELDNVINYGLPEVDDRYHIWRVPLLNKDNMSIGEVVIDAKTSLITEPKTTKKDVLEKRLLGRNVNKRTRRQNDKKYPISTLRNTIALGDSEQLLQEMPAESVDLIFTSPPYYNARPEYSDFVSYEDYLLKMRKVIQQCRRVLGDGRFFVINISPVLIRRSSRNDSSKRLAVPFDLHRIFIEEGYEFIDDIHWVKPDGAGWAIGRGRRFAADRNPLQYKAVPVTEYVLVYRKKTEKLIDWYIRNYPDKKILGESKIGDDYDKTNMWHIKPAHDKDHPAVFPVELAKRVIKYYSFKNDVVLDPFSGIGTVAQAAIALDRRFVMLEINNKYVEIMSKRLSEWMGTKVKDVNWIGFLPQGHLLIQKKLGSHD